MTDEDQTEKETARITWRKKGDVGEEVEETDRADTQRPLPGITESPDENSPVPSAKNQE